MATLFLVAEMPKAFQNGMFSSPNTGNYTFGLVDSFLEDNKCIVFSQGVDAILWGK
jgi:hypothetical protein